MWKFIQPKDINASICQERFHLEKEMYDDLSDIPFLSFRK